jgi:hypothetical protein
MYQESKRMNQFKNWYWRSFISIKEAVKVILTTYKQNKSNFTTLESWHLFFHNQFSSNFFWRPITFVFVYFVKHLRPINIPYVAHITFSKRNNPFFLIISCMIYKYSEPLLFVLGISAPSFSWFFSSKLYFQPYNFN